MYIIDVLDAIQHIFLKTCVYINNALFETKLKKMKSPIEFFSVPASLEVLSEHERGLSQWLTLDLGIL